MVSVVAFSFSNNRATLRPLTKEPKDSGLILGVRTRVKQRKQKDVEKQKVQNKENYTEVDPDSG